MNRPRNLTQRVVTTPSRLLGWPQLMQRITSIWFQNRSLHCEGALWEFIVCIFVRGPPGSSHWTALTLVFFLNPHNFKPSFSRLSFVVKHFPLFYTVRFGGNVNVSILIKAYLNYASKKTSVCKIMSVVAVIAYFEFFLLKSLYSSDIQNRFVL